MKGEVVLLQRSVYGLRRLSGVLLQETDIEQSKVGPCVLRKFVDREVTFIVFFSCLRPSCGLKRQGIVRYIFGQLLEKFPLSYTSIFLSIFGVRSDVTRRRAL